MWFEILPSFLIIAGTMAIPGWCMYHMHHFALGNAYRRNLDERWERVMYQRDYRLTGNPYKCNGLASIPEE